MLQVPNRQTYEHATAWHALFFVFRDASPQTIAPFTDKENGVILLIAPRTSIFGVAYPRASSETRPSIRPNGRFPNHGSEIAEPMAEARFHNKLIIKTASERHLHAD